MLIVQKYGGSSVRDIERIKAVAQRIVDTYKAGHQVIVVLSAPGDTTDDLIVKAKEISKTPSKREMDMLLSIGEQQSVALMAIAIHELGYPAISLNASQVGIHSSSAYSTARIKKIETDRIYAELERKNIVIITGFQGINKYGDVTTIGRGGSDTSAVAIAAVTNADLCEIYTDVDGVYTADPRIVKNAVKLNEISYNEMLELAATGAQVLQKRSVEMAKKYQVKLVVRSSFNNEEGTIVKEEAKVESMFVSGVAVDKNVSRVSIMGVPDVPGKVFQIFSMLAKKEISVDIIVQSINHDDKRDLSFTVTNEDLMPALKALEEHGQAIGYKELTHEENIAKVSIVGAGMANNPGVASLMFEALYDAGVNINMISTSEITISVLVDIKDAERATNAVHEKFMGENMRLIK